jgi:hypothetical protein
MFELPRSAIRHSAEPFFGRVFPYRATLPWPGCRIIAGRPAALDAACDAGLVGSSRERRAPPYYLASASFPGRTGPQSKSPSTPYHPHRASLKMNPSRQLRSAPVARVSQRGAYGPGAVSRTGKPTASQTRARIFRDAACIRERRWFKHSAAQMVQAGQVAHFTRGFGRGCGLSSHCSMTKTRTAEERLRVLHLPRQVGPRRIARSTWLSNWPMVTPRSAAMVQK